MAFIIYENFSWMTYNLLLAVIPVLLGWLVYNVKTKIIKVFLFFAWLIFVPNTIYIFTDVLHLAKVINRFNLLADIIIVIQYTLFLIAGYLTFVYSVYPIDKVFKSPKIIIILNFIIGFGMVLGRVYRLNSWDFILALGKLLKAITDAASSYEMITLSVLFGLAANLIYFLSKKRNFI